MGLRRQRIVLSPPMVGRGKLAASTGAETSGLQLLEAAETEERPVVLPVSLSGSRQINARFASPPGGGAALLCRVPMLACRNLTFWALSTNAVGFSLEPRYVVAGTTYRDQGVAAVAYAPGASGPVPVRTDCDAIEMWVIGLVAGVATFTLGYAFRT